VENTGDSMQEFNYGLTKDYVTLNSQYVVINPSWPIHEDTSCIVGRLGEPWTQEPYAFGNPLTDLFYPGDYAIYEFRISHHWDWIEPWNYGRILSIVTNFVLGYLKIHYLVAHVHTLLDFINTLEGYLATPVTVIEYTYNGIDDAQDISIITDVFTRTEKVDFLGQSIIEGSVASTSTTAGFALLLVPIAGPFLAAAAFIIEGVVWIDSEALYVQSYDPDSNYTELANPEPWNEPSLDDVPPGEIRNFTELAFDLLPITRAGAISYARYLGALEAGSEEWATIQLAATQYYTEQRYALLEELRNLSEIFVPTIPIPTPENISDFRDNLTQNGLPEIEVDILQQFGWTDDDIEELTQLLISANDSYYLRFVDMPETLTNLSLIVENTTKYLPEPLGESLLTKIGVDPDTLDLYDASGTLSLYVEFYNVSNLTGYHINSALLNGEIQPLSISQNPGDYDNDGIPDITIEYDAGMVVQILQEGEQLLSVFGNVSTPLNGTVNYSGSILVTVFGRAPNTPEPPVGSKIFFANVPYNCSSVTTDPEGSKVAYMFDWGDGNTSKWFGPYESGEIVAVEYNTWNKVGEYEIKVKVKDLHNEESNWSEPYVVNITEMKRRISIIAGAISNIDMCGDFTKVKAEKLFYVGFKPFYWDIFTNGEEIVIAEEILEVYRDQYFIVGLYKADVAIEQESSNFPYLRTLTRFGRLSPRNLCFRNK